MRHVALAALCVAMASASAATPSSGGEACDRRCLDAVLDRYLRAVVAHDPAKAPLTADFRQTENAVDVPRGAGAWQSITSLGKLQRHYLDVTTQSAGYYGTIVEREDGGIATLRLRVIDRKVSEAEWIIARKDTGTPQANGLGSTSVTGAELTPPPVRVLPVSERPSRDALIALANGYFDHLQSGDVRLFNAHPGWVRIENGIGTGEGPGGMGRGAGAAPYAGRAGGMGPPPPSVPAVSPATCGSICAVVARRYPIVDVEAGVVLAMVIFQRPPGSSLRRNLLTEWFVVDSGKVRGIHAAMHYLAPTVTAPNWSTEADGQGTGKYPATMLEDTSLPEHTIYRPAALQAFRRGQRLPVVVWGNGGCANTGNVSRVFLTEIATHGYLVIASGPVRELPVAVAGAPAPAPAPAPSGAKLPLSRTAQLLDAISWAESQSTRRGGIYAGHIDPTRIAVMGTSCGGLQAIEASVDPRVSTSLIWSSGLLDQPREGANATVDHLKRMHGPVLYVSGGADDMAAKPSFADFQRINGVPVFHGDNRGAGHGGPFKQPNGGNWAPVGVAWLDWQLKGDRQAAKMFVGADCGLCTDQTWIVEKKGID